MAESKSLNPKQLAFIAAYLHGDENHEKRFDATAAAIAVGFPARSASQRGYEFRHNPLVSARISEELSNRVMAPDEALAELAAVASAEWRHFLTIRTNPKTGEAVEVRMDLSAKIKALELICKQHGLFTEKVHVTGALTLDGIRELAESARRTGDLGTVGG